ncbi:hypothetical protein [Candidatus Coxiella mudrowiae]|uniref:hypothetical protein n=1 Tax=Candidatus Coxiella mudrowiae TaxID=2054173 RepID=UPI0006622EB3|nr:hypothetical protein [Candidatus Coxiella mudrowiae]
MILIIGGSAFFLQLVFLGRFGAAIFGVILLSVGMGAQDSLMCAIVAKMVSANKRAFVYRIFNGIYALFWFIGSFFDGGILYDFYYGAVVIFL